VPDLNHLWQRFLLASSLVVGLAIGAAATVFGYSNLGSVNVHWSVFHIDGVPLWAVAVVPLALFVVAGTLYHWLDGLHHFTEHMRHRRRVHELEAEVASLRAHLDQILEMPDHSTSSLPAKRARTASLPPPGEVIADPLPAAADVEPAEPAAAPTKAVVAAEPPEKPASGVPDGLIADKALTTSRAGHGRSRRRATLTVAAENGEPDRSGSHVEGTTAGGKAAKPAVRSAPEV
jgi:hypothetical protein